MFVTFCLHEDSAQMLSVLIEKEAQSSASKRICQILSDDGDLVSAIRELADPAILRLKKILR